MRSISVDWGAVPLPPRFGHVTVAWSQAYKARTGNQLSVFVAGEDVTERCYEADDVEGYARLFVHDANGRCFFGLDGAVARETRRGDVLIVGRPLEG